MAAEAGGGKPGLALHALPPAPAGSNVPSFNSIPDPGFALKKTAGKRKQQQQQEEKGKAVLLALMLVNLSMSDSEPPNVR